MSSLSKHASILIPTVVFVVLFIIITSKVFSELVTLVIVCSVSGPIFFLDRLTAKPLMLKRPNITSALNVIIVEVVFISITLGYYSRFSDITLIIGTLPLPILLYSILGYVLIKSRKSGTKNQSYIVNEDLTSRVQTLLPGITGAQVFVSDETGMRGIVKEIRKPVIGVVFRSDASQILSAEETDAALVDYTLLANGNYSTKILFYIFTVFVLQFDTIIGSFLILPYMDSVILQIIPISFLVATVASIALLGKIFLRITYAPILKCDLETLQTIRNREAVKSMIRKVSESRGITMSIMNSRYEKVKRIQEKQINRRISLVENARY